MIKCNYKDIEIEELKKREAAFLQELEKDDTKDPYLIYKNLFSGKAGRDYNIRSVTEKLLSEASNRCPMCGKLFIKKENDQLYPTIEHILPKKHYPRKIYDLQNYVIMCHRCNNSRGDNDKEHSNYINPYEIDYDPFRYGFDGKIYPEKDSDKDRVNTMIKYYDLDDKKLCIERFEYMSLLYNPKYKEMLEFIYGDIYNACDFKSVLFYDMYLKKEERGK